jgi:hypothetical protein
MTSIIPTKFTKSYHSEKYTISYLLDMLENGQININPDYQRGEVWSNDKKTLLIQSVLGNIAIPPLTFNVKKADNDDEDDVYECIDGKQRLSTLRDFNKNLFPFFNSDNKGTTILKKDMKKKWVNKFLQENLNIILYDNLDENQQREIFQRINYGMVLSYGEQIKGLNSPCIKELIQLGTKIKPLLKKLGITSKRDSILECIVCMYALYNNDLNCVSKGKSCIEYINSLDKTKMTNTAIFCNLTKDFILPTLIQILKETNVYVSNRYKNMSIKIKWTDIIIYSKILFDKLGKINKIDTNKFCKLTKDLVKKLITVSKHIAHVSQNSKYLFIESDEMSENDFSNEYNSYKELFGKRSNTNTKDYFSSRINLINKLYNYTQKNTDSKDEFRDKIYAKTGTAGESTCKICNDSKIDRRTFQAAHIISKFNGGCPELNNLFPTCSKCNNIMQTTDLDTYCTVHKIKLSL